MNGNKDNKLCEEYLKVFFQLLRKGAPENIEVCVVVAAGPVHEEMSWLNAEAELNIYPIFVTFSVFQLPMSWLNAEA